MRFLSVYSYATPFDWFLLAVGLLCACGNAAAVPVFSKFLGEFLDNVSADVANTRRELKRLGWIMAIIATLCGLVGFLQSMTYSTFSVRVTNRIRVAYFRALLRQEKAWHDKHPIGKVEQDITTHMTQIQLAIGEKMVDILYSFLFFIGALILAFALSPKLAAVIIASVPTVTMVGAVVSVLMGKVSDRLAVIAADVTTFVMERLAAHRTLASLCAQEDTLHQFQAKLLSAVKLEDWLAGLNGVNNGLIVLVLIASYAIAMWYGGHLVDTGGASAGDVLTVFFALTQGTEAFAMAFPSTKFIGEGITASKAVFAVIKRTPQVVVSSSPVTSEVHGDIELRDVRFAYPSKSDTDVLKGIDLHIEPGQYVGIIGSSGCGKTTICTLLQRLYDPTEGQIMLDGVPITEYDMDYLHSRIAVVAQEPVLFPTTIAANISFGKVGGNATDEEVVAAAQSANAHEFISALPHRYNTVLGERGTQLSGGQKQRIALARAFIKNPAILLLDEATSALDSESQNLVEQALSEFVKGRTTLSIAHRLSALTHCDRIIALENGVVTQDGNPTELAEATGLYHAMQTSQALLSKQGKQQADAESAGTTRFQKRLERHVSIMLGKDELFSSVALDGPKDAKRKSWRDRLTPAELSRLLQKHLLHRTRTTKNLLPLQWQQSPILIVTSLLSTVVYACCWPAFAIGVAACLGVMVDSQLPIFYFNRAKLYGWAGGLGVVAVVGALASFYCTLASFVICSRVSRTLKGETFQKILGQDPDFFDRPENMTDKLASMISVHVPAVAPAGYPTLRTRFQGAILLLGGCGIAIYSNWRLGLCLSCFAPFITITEYYLYYLSLTGADFTFFVPSNAMIIQTVVSMDTVKEICAEERLEHDFEHMLHSLRWRRMKIGLTTALYYCSFRFFLLGCLAFTIWYVGELVVKDPEAHFVVYIRAVLAVMYGASLAGQETAQGPNLTRAMKSAKLITSFPTPIVDVFAPENVGEIPETFPAQIKVEHVSYFYPLRPQVTALNDFCIAIPPNKKVAIVGPSGCGKSTFLQVVLRFAHPQLGNIIIGDTPLNEINVKWLRTHIGYVGQDPILFSTTILGNITLGKPDISGEQAVAAAKAATAHEFICNLEHDYQTVVGRHGISLSGGQRQRIAIARAIVHRPPLLLLDEATSALDNKTESEVQAALDHTMQSLGCTFIVVAHRLATIKNSDIIFVMDKGAVVEVGNHEQLIEKRGLYYHLVCMQS
eukprot:TRINITY_DN8602_c0_g1_i1.p1 TRINITY_DN8602_c0_g1~~TRINITY_DN8602_c0_g1_i1.p1  ORF type:complete len:1235 (+),score=335.62 TRINITY_DN8602_c0_g1_i1:398-4102(+)